MVKLSRNRFYDPVFDINLSDELSMSKDNLQEKMFGYNEWKKKKMNYDCRFIIAICRHKVQIDLEVLEPLQNIPIRFTDRKPTIRMRVKVQEQEQEQTSTRNSNDDSEQNDGG
ncbi:MAG: hypothetical protein HC906_04480 [Bacteroidales bacterium]|nr:hypothetical protein [Bacteroidales bacterium]